MSTMNPISDAADLIDSARLRIQSREFENAAWRLADAAGLLREFLDISIPEGRDLIGLDCPTGRGYVLPKKAQPTDDLVAKFEVRNVYGNETIYPANYQAERFAAIAGKKTLSRTDLMNIKALGFAVEEVFTKKIAA